MKKPWFNNSYNEGFDRRKEVKTQLFSDPFNKEKMMTYQERQKEANNIFRYENENMQEIY